MPSRAETSSPFAAIGQFGFFHEAPRALCADRLAVVLQGAEEGLPLRIDRVRVLLVARVEVLDIARIRPVQERGLEEGFVGILAGHDRGSVCLSLSVGIRLERLQRTRLECVRADGPGSSGGSLDAWCGRQRIRTPNRARVLIP